MALPSSGALSISAIKTELGSASNSLRTLSGLAGFSTPDSISEFYGYSALLFFSMTQEQYQDGGNACQEGPNGALANYYATTDPIALNTYILDENRDAFNGNDMWYYYPSGTTSFQIDSLGKVIDINSCE